MPETMVICLQPVADERALRSARKARLAEDPLWETAALRVQEQAVAAMLDFHRQLHMQEDSFLCGPRAQLLALGKLAAYLHGEGRALRAFLAQFPGALEGFCGAVTLSYGQPTDARLRKALPPQWPMHTDD